MMRGYLPVPSLYLPCTFPVPSLYLPRFESPQSMMRTVSLTDAAAFEAEIRVCRDRGLTYDLGEVYL